MVTYPTCNHSLGRYATSYPSCTDSPTDHPLEEYGHYLLDESQGIHISDDFYEDYDLYVFYPEVITHPTNSLLYAGYVQRNPESWFLAIL